MRGTFGDWKQIVHFSFNEKLERLKLFEVIDRVQSTGLRVCSIVSDMGTKNQALWKELNVGQAMKGEISTTSFKNPTYDSRIFIFPDYPHLLKLLRNHLIDSTLTLPDGTLLNKYLIEQLLHVQKHDLKLTFRVTHKHINLNNNNMNNKYS